MTVLLDKTRDRPAREPALPAWLLAGIVLCAALRSPAAGAQRPTLQAITIDGNFADWAAVLANPANASTLR